jgi:hypothetical protein
VLVFVALARDRVVEFAPARCAGAEANDDRRGDIKSSTGVKC